jgi:hypothetical protein
MNRIYQGRVTKLETLKGKNADGQPQELPNWQTALWQHHELFQDAVNYYTLALAAMAGEPEGDSVQVKALQEWVAKVRETWKSASRKAEVFAGPAARLAPILKLDPDKSEFEAAAARVLQSSRATAAQRSAALLQLLAEKGDLNKVCGERIAFLCPANPRQKKRPTSKAVSSVQELERQQEVRRFRQLPQTDALKQAATLKLGLFLTQPPTEFLEGPDAAKELREKFSKASARFEELKAVSPDFEKLLAAQSATLRVPSPGRKPSGLYPAAAIFKFYPCRESLEVFLQTTKSLAEAKDKAVVSDAIAEARVADQPHFDYFTNLALVAGDDDERDTRAVWFEFDLAAFIEAIKAPRRYFEDTLKRKAAAERLRQQIAAMEGKGRESSVADEEGETIPGFEGDPRIVLLRDIVQKRLAWLAEAEGDVSGPAAKEYVIRERTLRGFGEIKRR